MSAAQTKSIAISRQRGSGGSYIGRAVAERLGVRYFDREMLRVAAEYLSGPEHGSKEDEQPGGWFERFGAALSHASFDAGYVPPSPTALYEGELADLENRLIREIVDDHIAVIVGRGAAQLLAARPGVVTVFVHAPVEWRVDRVRQVYTAGDRAAASRMVQQSDRDRTRFIRRVADVEWADPRCYDLAINSMALGFDAAVDLIVRSAAAPGVAASTIVP